MRDSENKTDEELVKASLEDVEEFAVLVDRYEQKLKYYILRISSFSLEESEEILQEVFLKVWQNLNDFDLSVKFSSWIYRITHNETISAFRKFQSRGEDKQVSINEEVYSMSSSKINLEKEFEQKVNTGLIQKVLFNMSDKYREIIVLRYFEEKSYDEISDILKKSIGTVGTLVNRAKKQFREQANKLKIEFSFKE